MPSKDSKMRDAIKALLSKGYSRGYVFSLSREEILELSVYYDSDNVSKENALKNHGGSLSS